MAFFRTTGEWLAGLPAGIGQSLTGGDRERLTTLLEALTDPAPDVQDARHLVLALLAGGRKVEQERF